MPDRPDIDDSLIAKQASQSLDRSPAPLGDALPGVNEPYDPHLADEAIRLPQLILNRRCFEVLFGMASFLIAAFFSALFPSKELTESERAAAKAKAVKELLFSLGPTFIKLGQFLSVRRDVLPQELADELALLQDKVPPFGLELVRKTIAADLGKPPEELFDKFEAKPIASASIGQVHRVVLKDGNEAVIKIQRPGLPKEFYRDLGLMRLIARWGMWLKTLLDNLSLKPSNRLQNMLSPRAESLDFAYWLDLSDEFGRTLFSEIDYIQEGKNADRLRRVLRPKPAVRVPRVFWRYTGRHVLTLEYIGGTKITQIKELKNQGIDLKQIATLLVNCYLEQFVLTGFFHADPHAGNLAVENTGALVIYDFGMMGEINYEQRRSLLSVVMAVVRKDPEAAVKHLQDLGIVSGQASLATVSRAITPFIDYYAGRDIMELDFDHLEHDIDEVIAQRSFVMPANLAYLLRAGSSLEGIARTLVPDFDFSQAVKPVMTRWALTQGMETLAKNGRFLDFAGFAFDELRKSMAKGAKVPHVKNNGKPATSVAAKSKHPVKSQQDLPPRLEADPVKTTPALVNCKSCSEMAKASQALSTRTRTTLILGVGYLVSSLGLTVFLANVVLPDYRQISVYFLIGNIVLGAIIFWKFINLIKWTPYSHSPEGKKGRGNGD
jgi:predicted unusual protein kinase regulating ubiquinone biosynthesis (AarF/ABC1/UbiB family)